MRAVLGRNFSIGCLGESGTVSLPKTPNQQIFGGKSLSVLPDHPALLRQSRKRRIPVEADQNDAR